MPFTSLCRPLLVILTALAPGAAAQEDGLLSAGASLASGALDIVEALLASMATARSDADPEEGSGQAIAMLSDAARDRHEAAVDSRVAANTSSASTLHAGDVLLGHFRLVERLGEATPPSHFKNQYTMMEELGDSAQTEAWLVQVTQDLQNFYPEDWGYKPAVLSLKGGQKAVLKLLYWEELDMMRGEPVRHYLTTEDFDRCGKATGTDCKSLVRDLRKDCLEAQMIQMQAAQLPGRGGPCFLQCLATNSDRRVPDHPSKYFFQLVEKRWYGTRELAFEIWQGDGLPVHQIKRTAVQLLQGLDTLSKMDPPRIHGNIKPTNVMVRAGDHETYTHLIDFRSMQQADSHLLRMHPKPTGSVGYMPPEVFDKNLRYASTTAFDAHAFGATFVQMSTGMEPKEYIGIVYDDVLADYLAKNQHPKYPWMIEPSFGTLFSVRFCRPQNVSAGADVRQLTRDGYFCPIRATCADGSEQTFGAFWWLELLAGLRKGGKPFVPKFRLLWKALQQAGEQELFASLLDRDPLRRPTPERLLGSNFLKDDKEALVTDFDWQKNIMPQALKAGLSKIPIGGESKPPIGGDSKKLKGDMANAWLQAEAPGGRPPGAAGAGAEEERGP